MYFWMFAVPLFILAACWVWLAWSRRLNWPVADHGNGSAPLTELQHPPGENKDQAVLLAQHPPENWHTWLFQRRWLLGLGLALLGLAFYVFVFAPPRLGGQIPIQPLQPGRPFYSLRWLRDFAQRHYEHLGMLIVLLGSLSSAGILLLAHWRRWRLAGEISLMLISLTLAAFGQWLVNFEIENVGAVLYAIAIIGFASWAWLARTRIYQDLNPARTEFRFKELLLVAGIFALAAFARFYALEAVPYGFEGDETKWVYEVVQLMVDGQSDSSGEYHRDALPVSFYMQAPFQRFLEAGVHAARLGVAFYSLLATLLFYGLIRQLAPVHLALLSSFLLSISIMDISASRMANVESHVKLWPILALALLAAAIRTRRWEIYALSGLALALGLLTYDTVWPLLFVVLVLTLLNIASQTEDWKSRSTKIAALFLPTLLTLPVLIPYFSSRLSYYRLHEKGWQTGAGVNLWQSFLAVLNSWFIQTKTDFIYNRQGPIINAALLPVVALGLVIAFLTLRSQFSRWVLVWAGLFLLPVPVLATSPFGRVYYPALPTVYALAALGLYLLGREAMRLLGSAWLPLGYILGIAIVVWLPLLNLYIYFNEVEDPSDRQVRSEIGAWVQQTAGPQAYLYLPYYSESFDPLFYEQQVVKLGMHQKLPLTQMPASYERILYDRLLPAVLAQKESGKTIEILLDKANSLNSEPRQKVAETLLRCFPQGKLFEGQYFDRYSLEPAALARPDCLPVEVSLRLEDQGNAAVPAQPLKLLWSLSSAAVSEMRLLCAQGRADVIRIEGEDLIPGEGWRQDIAYVDGWTGDGYLTDSYNSAYASTLVDLPLRNQENRDVYVWVRYYKRTFDNSPAYIFLENQILTFADGSSGNLNTWVWERLGPFHPEHELTEWKISRPYAGDPYQFSALFIDALVFTTDAQFSPVDEAFWALLPVSDYALPAPAQEGRIEIELSPGHYACALEVVSHLPLVDALGGAPVKSNIIELNIPEP